MNNLAFAYKDAGRLDKALPLFKETLRLRTVKLGADHPDTLTSMNNLAWGYRDASRLDKSLPLFEQAAIGVEKRRFQHEFADRIVPSFIGALEEAKNWPKAETWRRKWLAVVREESGASSGAYADELRGLGVNLLQQNKFTDAEPALRDCLPILAKTQPDNWTTFNTKSLLGAALLGQKKYAQAQLLLHQGYGGLKLRERTIPNHARVCLAETAERLVALYQALDQPEEVKWWQAEKARVLKGKTPSPKQP